jgi:hypothetical protein
MARHIWIGINMPAPLVGAAAAAAARLVAKKLGSKAVKKATAAKKQAATRAETVKIAKNSVKVKNPAKPQAAEKDIMTVIRKRAVRNEQISAKGKPGFSMGKTKLIRQMKASNKKKSK